MNKIYCILVFLSCFFLWGRHAAASGFEGDITLVKETLYDTMVFNFKVKDAMVRIDEKNTKNEIIQSIIVNLDTKRITALSPSQKLFTTIYKNRVPDRFNVNILKTRNYKYINGLKCYQWRVRNSALNTEAALWVCEGHFAFFSKVMDLLSKTQDYADICRYFSMIPGNSGYFPVLIVERTLLREEKSRMLVKSITPQVISDRIFQVPGDYKCLIN